MATVKKFEELNSVKKLLSGQNHILIITKKKQSIWVSTCVEEFKIKTLISPTDVVCYLIDNPL